MGFHTVMSDKGVNVCFCHTSLESYDTRHGVKTPRLWNDPGGVYIYRVVTGTEPWRYTCCVLIIVIALLQTDSTVFITSIHIQTHSNLYYSHFTTYTLLLCVLTHIDYFVLLIFYMCCFNTHLSTPIMYAGRVCAFVCECVCIVDTLACLAPSF